MSNNNLYTPKSKHLESLIGNTYSTNKNKDTKIITYTGTSWLPCGAKKGSKSISAAGRRLGCPNIRPQYLYNIKTDTTLYEDVRKIINKEDAEFADINTYKFLHWCICKFNDPFNSFGSTCKNRWQFRTLYKNTLNKNLNANYTDREVYDMLGSLIKKRCAHFDYSEGFCNIIADKFREENFN